MKRALFNPCPITTHAHCQHLKNPLSTPQKLKPLKSKGSIGHAFTVCIRTENQNQVSFCPFAPREVSVLAELTLRHIKGHLPVNILYDK